MPVNSGQFSARCRLRRARDFDVVFETATVKKLVKPVRVLAIPTDLGFARLGIIVPKRRVPLAVNRNRVRRIVREWFRTSTFGAYDIVILVQAYDRTGFDLRKALAQIRNQWSQQC